MSLGETSFPCFYRSEKFHLHEWSDRSKNGRLKLRDQTCSDVEACVTRIIMLVERDNITKALEGKSLAEFAVPKSVLAEHAPVRFEGSASAEVLGCFQWSPIEFPPVGQLAVRPFSILGEQRNSLRLPFISSSDVRFEH